ncbi:MAG: hypothetical protein K5905_01545 [Roseibium sp.]|uniref:hypothetical protein n=1 Tax=Roseibium sp. TaxID=1936156 RepID=UPI0026384D3C|nr:hypothetical protein [Roseibium sp.]MCV0424134.1 hypothetical protein [Roseibium sp.]
MLENEDQPIREMPLCMETIQRLAMFGITFKIEFYAAGFQTEIHIRPDDIPRFLDHAPLFVASYFGVTLEQYYDWLETDGYPRCSARIGTDRPCKRPVLGVQCGPKEWALRDGGLCEFHRH